MGFKGPLSKINAFPRAEEHLMQKTTTGAAVTIIGMLLMATLFFHELRYQLSIRTVHQMSVETKRGEKLPIAINITFPALPCKVLSLDAIDMSGKHEVDLDTNIWKIRINKDGYIIGSEFVNDLVEGEHKTEEEKHLDLVKVDDFGHHHQVDDEHGHNHAPKPIGDPEKVMKEIKTALEQREGCRHSLLKLSNYKLIEQALHVDPRGFNVDEIIERQHSKLEPALGSPFGGLNELIFGVLDVERVAGNFHVSMHGLSIFVAQQIYESVTDVNVSHVIHDLSFGPKYPGIQNPLDSTTRILHEESGTFKYFIKVVPTEYRFLNGMVMPTNQFSVTEYFTSSKSYDRNWPAVFFVYDLSPISVTIKEERHHFGHFLTRICAVIGGTFAVTGMLDRWIYGLVELVMSSQKGKRVMR